MESINTDDLAAIRERIREKFARFAESADRDELMRLEQTIDSSHAVTSREVKIGKPRQAQVSVTKRQRSSRKTARGAAKAASSEETLSAGRYPLADEQPVGDPEFERAKDEGPRHSPYEGRLNNLALFYVDVVSAKVMAEMMGMSKPPLLERARDGRLLGWQDARNQWCFPTAQLDSFGRVLGGIPEVWAEFGDSMHAWWWLNEPNRDIDGQTPLQGLRDGRVAEVIQSTQNFALGAFS